MTESIEQPQKTEEGSFFVSDRKKEGLSTVEKNIAKILMESKIYSTLSSQERLEIIQFLESRFKGLKEYLDSEDAEL